MKFIELNLNHFGKFHHKTISLQDGINIIYGSNEAGKSTIHSFIRGMLFGIEKTRGRTSKDDLYGKYQPWDSPGAYSGSMDLQLGERKIRIYRSFEKNNKELSVIDIDTGREIKEFYDNPSVFLEGLTESGYRNTISIEQLKAKTGQELADEVRNYITNLSLAKSNEVDVAKALGFLTARKKELESLLPRDEIEQIRSSIDKGLAAEARIDELTEKLETLQKEELLLMNSKESIPLFFYPNYFHSIDEYEEYLNKYPVYEEKFNSYQNLIKQLGLVESKISQLQNHIKDTNLLDAKTIAKKQEELNQYKIKSSNLLIEKSKLLNEKKETKNGKTKILISIGLLLVGLILLYLGFTGNGIFTGVGIVCLLTNFLAIIFGVGKQKKVKESFDNAIEEINQEIKELDEKIKKLLTSCDVKDELQLKNKYEFFLRLEVEMAQKQEQINHLREDKQRLKSQIQTIEEEIISYFNPFDGLVDKLNIPKLQQLTKEDMITAKSYITDECNHLREVKEATLRQLEDCTIKKEKIKWELKSLERYEEELLKNQEKLIFLEKKEKNILNELEAIKLAMDTIHKLSIDIHDSFGQELNKMTSYLTAKATAGKYTEIKVDEKLDIKVLDCNQYVNIEKLSTGTIEQLYFAIRVAVANIIYGEEVMPLLFDDSFVFYDDKRTLSVLEYLSKRKGQVLIFTCQTREKELLDQNHIGYNYIDLGNNLSKG